MRLDADPLEHGFDLRPAAVHHDRIDRGLLQQHDVAGEFARQAFLAHGMAAIFDDDGLFVVALHVGQRFRQDTGLHLGADGVALAHCLNLPALQRLHFGAVYVAA